MSANSTTTADVFAAERTRLFGIAYRMLGSRADAEDVLQDAWLRWSESDSRRSCARTQAWLTTIVTRLSIDRLRSAKAQREVYVGPWLPEPLADIDPVDARIQGGTGQRSVDRVPEPARTARSRGARRVGLARRVRLRLRRYRRDARQEHRRLAANSCIARVNASPPNAGAFKWMNKPACACWNDSCTRPISGDIDELKSLFASDARMISDGGGKAVAVRRILHGAERICASVDGDISSQRRRHRTAHRADQRRAGPGHLVPRQAAFGRPRSIPMASASTTYYTVANPDKLTTSFQMR